MSSISPKRMAFIAGGLCLLAIILLMGQIALFLTSPAQKGGADRIVVLKEGLSFKEVTEELVRTKVITHKPFFLVWARLMGYSKKIKAGEYRLGPSMSPLRILDILTKGAIITHSVTIPEGFTRVQIAALLSDKALVNKEEFLSLTADPEVLGEYGVTGPNLEGYLYPDTYQFGRGLSAKSIIGVMVRRFREITAPFRARAEEMGMTMAKVVTLASIVEKETGLEEERPLIASVFLNRMKAGMRLESDPTVIYGIEDFGGNLTRKDLATRTSYNTYVIRGLPPGPIANPGREAIKAVLYPAETDYLYFVSKNDGSHYFSKILSEHNRAVKLYQKKNRKRREGAS